MNTYAVRCEIEIVAESAREAVAEVRRMSNWSTMIGPDLTTMLFDVKDKSSKSWEWEHFDFPGDKRP